MIKKIITAATVTLLTCIGMQATTVQVNVSRLKGELTEALRETLQPLTYTDTAVIYFDQAKKYTLLGTVEARCHVELKGCGKSKTTLIFDRGSDSKTFKAFTDDTFLGFYGKKRHNISVSIHDIALKLKDHNDIWWDEAHAKFLVKIYHADKVDVRNVNSESHNAACTNFDLRVCSNVTFTKCDIVNYNNCEAGGNLWLRGEMHNVNVSNCKLVKYGNDECLAIFGRVTDAYDYAGKNRKDAVRSDINITDNEFRYEYKGKSKVNMFNEMFFSAFTDYDNSAYCCRTQGLHITGNTFYMNDLTNRTLYLQYQPNDIHTDVVIEGNKFVNAAINSDDRYYRQDIDINDLSASTEAIVFKDNVVTNNCAVVTEYGTTGYSHLLVRGGNVTLQSDKIVNNALTSTLTDNEVGVQLLWFGEQGGTVTMNDNVCRGLKGLATASAGNGIDRCAITATGNTFSGDTRIYCNKVKHMDLDFTGNTFVSNSMNFFLQEFASEGTLVFNRNTVTVSKGSGQLMTHWSKAALGSMVFTRLEVTGNDFRNVKERDLLVNITNVKSRKISKNSYR